MMKRRKVYLSPRNASIVRLNVGGRAFHTTEDTLSLCSYFQPVLDGRLQHGTDEQGRLFIDRDPRSIFHHPSISTDVSAP